jgi:predicted  nucleic acid-binding Zn-ribbon protein
MKAGGVTAKTAQFHSSSAANRIAPVIYALSVNAVDFSPRMDVQLELLIRLQAVDIKVTQLTETIAALPAQLRSLEQKLAQQKMVVEQADKAVPAEEARRRRLESDRKDQQQKLIKYRDQSNSVKTNEQFHALQHEVGFVEAEIRRIEDEELSSMIKSESLESERSEARKASALLRKRSGRPPRPPGTRRNWQF